MSWLWHCYDPQGELVAEKTSEDFPSQSDAESWLGENWRELSKTVDKVELLEDDRVEYAMSLAAVEP